MLGGGGQDPNYHWSMDNNSANCYFFGTTCITLTGKGVLTIVGLKEFKFSEDSDKVTISETQMWCLYIWYYISYIVIKR